jgi:hypothetical protein
LRLKQECRMGGGAKALQKIEEQGGFAHPRLRYQDLESEVAIDPIDQRCQRLAMSMAQVQETGIGGNAKGVFPQPEMAQELTSHRGFRSIAPQ